MSHCKIEITTITEGKRECFTANGTFIQAQGENSVRYTQDGDEVTLKFDMLRFRMTRYGKTALSCLFCPQERTLMKIEGYGGRGEIPVNTSRYTYLPNENGCAVTLRYRLNFLHTFQSFHLELKIETSEEK